MLDKLEALATPARRRWLYRIAWATLAVLGVYGVITLEQLAVWLLAAAAVLGVADGHTDPTAPTGMPRRGIPPEDAP